MKLKNRLRNRCVYALALAFVFATFAVLAGCSGSNDENVFILGLDDAFPPMGYRDKSGEIVGYDIDLANEVTRRLRMKLVIRPIEWSMKEDALYSQTIDCIWNGFTITPERRETMLFSPPYLINAQVFVVKATSDYAVHDDFAGKKIGVQAGSSGAQAVEDDATFMASLLRVEQYPDFDTAILDLESGGVEAVVMDLLVANDAIKKSGKALRILDDALAPEEYGIGFRKSDTELCDKVWKTLMKMHADGTVKTISEKWFGADISIIGK